MAVPARILIVDDDLDCRNIYGEFLSLVGHHVVTAVDGEEGVVYATRYPFDLVVLDLAIPKLDGLKVIKELRSHPATKATPILAVTAGDAPLLTAALRAGADRTLAKPCLPGDLEKEIRMCLDRGRRWQRSEGPGT